MPTVTRALFINSGILGQRTFAKFVRQSFEGEADGVEVIQSLITDDLTLQERIVRWLLCLRVWPPGLAGLKNLDLHRYRCEVNAGLVGRHRILRLERERGPFHVLHFHRQATAYGSVDIMNRIPSIVSVDSTQRCVLQHAQTKLEVRSYGPNIRRDGEIFRAAKLIVSTSAWAARSIREEYPDCTTEIAVMPNPVQLPPGSDRWIEERYARARAGELPRVLFVGGDFPRKGGFDLLRVWRAARLHDRASLHIMSNWPIEEDALPPNVTMHRGIHSHTPAWNDIWRAADIFVLPTRDEAFGIVFQEAAAAGVPAIGTDLNAIPETIEHGVSGLLVLPEDDDGLVGAIETLISSPDTRRAMGQAGRDYIVRSADPVRYRRRLAAEIRRLAGH